MIDYVKTEIGKFSDKQFGMRTDPRGPLNHLKEEVDELLEAIGEKNEEEEWADCILLLLDAFRIRFGNETSFNKLLHFALNKLDVLETREWYPDPNIEGVYRSKK